MIIGIGIGLDFVNPNGIDADASAYIRTAGVTDPAAKVQINNFVKSLKANSMWSSLVEGWPLCSAQNAGTGSTAFALKSSNFTLVNTPTWGTNGISLNASTSQALTSSAIIPDAPCSIIVIGKPTTGTGGPTWNFRNNTSTPADQRRGLTMYPVSANNLFTNLFSSGIHWAVTALAAPSVGAAHIHHGNVTGNTTGELYFDSSLIAGSYNGKSWADGAVSSNAGFYLATNGGTLIYEVSGIFIFNTAISSSTFSSIYKSTLGSGLGLP